MLQAKALVGIREMLGSSSLKVILMLGGLLSLFPRLAIATLGAPAQSIADDQRILGGQLQTLGQGQFQPGEPRQPASSTSYTVEQISTPAGVVVNEYVSPDGTVFAVSWRGPRPPDLSQILGPYFAQFQTAAVAPGRQQRHLVLKTQGLVIETGGHMRDLRGRAYIPSLLPPNVSTEEIR
jgi:Protein of unknown function (DUF2844)